MRKTIILTLTFPIFFWGCASQFAALKNNRNQDVAIEEIRVEIADLKHTVNGNEVEMHLLEQKLEATNPMNNLSNTLNALKRKIALLEQSQDKLTKEIRSLTIHAEQTTTSLVQFRDQIGELDHRFDDLKGLKKTLSSISKSIETSKTPYKIKPGDSLEKIAKQHHVSVKSIMELNHLHNDRIIIGQELVIPHE